jgi:general secretion pathway protein H
MSEITEQHRPSFGVPCGFTLVEMLVILAILTFMASIVFPSLDKTMRRQTFVEAARRVEWGARAARAMAVAEGTPVVFAAAADGHGFRYAAHDERLPDGVTLATPARGIRFFADGSAQGGEIALSDGRFRQRLRVDGTLGKVEHQP